MAERERIDREKMEVLKAEVEKYRRAGRQFANAGVDLWDSTLSVAIAMEDTETIKQIMRQNQLSGWGGDGNCGPLAEPNCLCSWWCNIGNRREVSEG